MVGSRKKEGGWLRYLTHAHMPTKKIKRGTWQNQHPHGSTQGDICAFKSRHYTRTCTWKMAALHLNLPNAQTYARWLAIEAQGQGHDRGFLWNHGEKKKQKCSHLPSWLQIFIPLSPKGLKWKRGGVGKGTGKQAPVTTKMQKSCVHVANALAKCKPPTPPQVACQLNQEGERQKDREKREEGLGV